MKKYPKIIAFAGPSGVGKSTLVRMLMDHSSRCEPSISATTRPLRGDEENGKHYFFFKEQKFKEAIKENAFIEWEEVYPGCYYGTLHSEIKRIHDLGKVVILDIDVLGTINLKNMFGNEIYIVFVKPESIEELKNRLRARRTESESSISMRIARFEKEFSYENQFDYLLLNKTDDFESSQNSILEIIDKCSL